MSDDRTWRGNRAAAQRVQAGLVTTPLACEPIPADCQPGAPASPDDRTTEYVLASRPQFNRLRQAASQLAGLMLLSSIGGRDIADQPMLGLAAASIAEAAQGLAALRPTGRAAHHHHHLLLAAQNLSEAAQCPWPLLPASSSQMDRASALVSAAIAHLRWAGNALPGFELASLSQGCCAAHASALQAPRDRPATERILANG